MFEKYFVESFVFRKKWIEMSSMNVSGDVWIQQWNGFLQDGI